MHLALAHGHRVNQSLQLIHRHWSSAVQLLYSILTDQDYQEIIRFDFKAVTHSGQLIFAEPGCGNPGARNGLIVPFGDYGNIQHTAASELDRLGFELIELFHQLRVVQGGSEDQQRAVAVVHSPQGVRPRRASIAGLLAPVLPTHRSKRNAR